MDYSSEYQTALKLASSLRYSEAKQKLESVLSGQPDNIDALILLGKVEYYLGYFSSSRRRFETVLTSNPGNFEAYYGLQFFVERKRRIWTIAAWFTSIVLLLLLGVFINISIKNSFNRFEAGISKQREYYLEFEKALSNKTLDILDNLNQYANNLDEFNMNTEQGMEKLRKSLDGLENKIKERFLEIENNQFEYYRSTLIEIQDLKQKVLKLEEENSGTGSALPE